MIPEAVENQTLRVLNDMKDYLSVIVDNGISQVDATNNQTINDNNVSRLNAMNFGARGR